jgi:non-ribosomal peptide synthetase component F
VANRNHPDLENLIGFFVNILPVRTRLNDTMEFDELLAQVVAAADDAFEHQDYPFDLLVQKVNPHRSTNRQPLLNVIYAFQNFSDVHVEVGGLGAVEDGAATAELAPTQAFAQAFKTSKFDLTLFVTDEAGRLQCTLEYDTGLFRPETIRRHLGVLRRFATMVAATAPAAN